MDFQGKQRRTPDTTERMGFALEDAKRTLEQLRGFEAEGRAVDRTAIEQLEETIRRFEAYADDRLGSRPDG